MRVVLEETLNPSCEVQYVHYATRVIWFQSCILTRHLYFCGVWLVVDLRMGTNPVIVVHAQNLLTTLGSIVNITGGGDLSDHLRRMRIFTSIMYMIFVQSSKIYGSNYYSLNLDLPITSYPLHV